MAGRGRARGGGAGGGMPIPASSMAFGRKDAPAALQFPPELYPSVFFKAAPLRQEESDRQIASFKERFVKQLRSSPFYIQASEKSNALERYSDKYETMNKQRHHVGHRTTFTLAYDLMPDELRPKIKAKRKVTSCSSKTTPDNFEDIRKKLDNLEEKEDNAEDKEEEEKEEEADGEEVEVYHEEEGEEENDYAMSYFDNGEDYLNESDDNMDKEATF